MAIEYLTKLTRADKSDMIRMAREGTSIRDVAAAKRVKLKTLNDARLSDPSWSSELARAVVEGHPLAAAKRELDPDFEWHQKQDFLRELQQGGIFEAAGELLETLRTAVDAGDMLAAKELNTLIKTFAGMLPKRSHSTSEAKVDQTNRNLNVGINLTNASRDEKEALLRSMQEQLAATAQRHLEAADFERSIDVTTGYRDESGEVVERVRSVKEGEYVDEPKR